MMSPTIPPTSGGEVGGRRKQKKEAKVSSPGFLSTPDLPAKTDQGHLSASNYTQYLPKYEKIYCSEVIELLRSVIRFAGSLDEETRSDPEKLRASFLNVFKKRKSTPKYYEVLETDDEKYLFIKRIMYKGRPKEVGVLLDPLMISCHQGKVNHFLDYIFSRPIQVQEDNEGNDERYYLSFPLSALTYDCGCGLFSTTREARRSINQVIAPALTSIGLIFEGDEEEYPLIESIEIKKSIVMIDLNIHINWIDFFKKTWTFVSTDYFKLSPKAAEICHYLAYRARQGRERGELVDKGFFSMSWSSLIDHLYLQRTGKALKPKVINPILRMFDEMEGFKVRASLDGTGNAIIKFQSIDVAIADPLLEAYQEMIGTIGKRKKDEEKKQSKKKKK